MSIDKIYGAKSLSQIAIPDFALNVMTPYNPASLAYSDTQFEILKQYVQDFEASLSPNEDVALLLTNFGQSTLMVVSEIGYEDSVLMIFKGLVNGSPATLIQHVSQLNFLLTSVPHESPEPRRSIGFSASESE